MAYPESRIFTKKYDFFFALCEKCENNNKIAVLGGLPCREQWKNKTGKIPLQENK